MPTRADGAGTRGGRVDDRILTSPLPARSLNQPGEREVFERCEEGGE